MLQAGSAARTFSGGSHATDWLHDEQSSGKNHAAGSALRVGIQHVCNTPTSSKLVPISYDHEPGQLRPHALGLGGIRVWGLEGRSLKSLMQS